VPWRRTPESNSMRTRRLRRAKFEQIGRRVPRNTGARMGRDLPRPCGAVRRSLAIEAHRRRNRSLVPTLGPLRRVGCAGALVLPAELDSRSGWGREPAASVGGSPLRSFPCKSCDGGSTVRVGTRPRSAPWIPGRCSRSTTEPVEFDQGIPCHSRVTHSRNPGDTGGHGRTRRRLSSTKGGT
jgi:hypothetical protein